jgi:hypothetical protein
MPRFSVLPAEVTISKPAYTNIIAAMGTAILNKANLIKITIGRNKALFGTARAKRPLRNPSPIVLYFFQMI